MNLQGLFRNAKNVEKFQAGETIFAEGSFGDIMYVVLDGEITLQIDGVDFEVISSGDILGEMALIDAKERSTTAIAKSDCSLAPIDEKHFLFLVQQTPFFALHVMRELVSRLRKMHAK